MIELLGYLASLLVLCAFCTKTTVLLRLFAIGSNTAFIVYGALLAIPPVLILHSILLPLNAWRLCQILRACRRARAGNDRPFAALAPFACPSRRRRGDIVTRRGDRSDAVYLVIAGTLRVVETEADLGPGTLVGEIGVLSSAQTRTATVVATSDCVLGRVCPRDFRRIYDATPALRLPLVRLIIDRLSQDLEARRHGPAFAPAL